MKALIFDCDGVLADTELDGHLVAFNETFEHFGLPFRWSKEKYDELLAVGGGKERFIAFVKENPDYEKALPEPLEDFVLKVHAEKSKRYIDRVEAGLLPGRPGVARIINEALDAGWQVAVASTSAVASVEAVIRTVIGEEGRQRLAGVWAGDMVPKKKPAPDIYLEAMKGVNVEPENVVVVEDSNTGAKAAAAANVRYLVTLSTFTVNEEFPKATTVVSNLGEPGEPATIREGADVLQDGMITVESLDEILSLPIPSE
ncbi:HAD-IA family hydrolase [Flaviflexus huanghaiensis]|uniref:HAD-IA family hydrolase n=1 Tax=Flaviflexus huanghaiensis TaxID=1111473 RepID=UPI0015F9A771|nr:HAD-IA family hydrolase [Flaviflexus huanghaiensis]